MYGVLSSRAAWSSGRSGAAGVFLARGQTRDSSTRHTLARRQQTESVECYEATASDVSEPVCSLSTVLLVDSLVVTHVEFPTFLSFESETCRASVFWETRG